jgi:hypothetical protein
MTMTIGVVVELLLLLSLFVVYLDDDFPAYLIFYYD